MNLFFNLANFFADWTEHDFIRNIGAILSIILSAVSIGIAAKALKIVNKRNISKSKLKKYFKLSMDKIKKLEPKYLIMFDRDIAYLHHRIKGSRIFKDFEKKYVTITKNKNYTKKDKNKIDKYLFDYKNKLIPINYACKYRIQQMEKLKDMCVDKSLPGEYEYIGETDNISMYIKNQHIDNLKELKNGKICILDTILVDEYAAIDKLRAFLIEKIFPEDVEATDKFYKKCFTGFMMADKDYPKHHINWAANCSDKSQERIDFEDWMSKNELKGG